MFGPQIVFNVPYKPNPILRWIVRTCLALLLIGSAIFTTMQFYAALERTKAHGHTNSTPRSNVDGKGSRSH